MTNIFILLLLQKLVSFVWFIEKLSIKICYQKLVILGLNKVILFIFKKDSINMDGVGSNMCKAVNIEGVAVKATFVSRVCIGGKTNMTFLFTIFEVLKKKQFLYNSNNHGWITFLVFQNKIP